MSPRKKPNGTPNPNSITETSRLLAGDPAIIAQYFKKYRVKSTDELYHRLFELKASHAQMSRKEWNLFQALARVVTKNHRLAAQEHPMHFEHNFPAESKPPVKALRDNPIIKAMRRNNKRRLP